MYKCVCPLCQSLEGIHPLSITHTHTHTHTHTRAQRGVGCERSQERADRWRLKAVQTLDLKAEANLRNASYEQDVLRPKASQ